MRTIHVPIVVCIVAGMSAVAGAHVGPTYFVAPVNPSTITIDGKGDDPGWDSPLWDPMYTITKDMLSGNATGGEMPSDEDWNGSLRVGCTPPPESALYFYSEVTDDVLNDDAVRNRDSDSDDSLCILVDANHDGGDYDAVEPRGTIAQQYQIRMSERDLPPGPAQDEGHTRTFTYAPTERAWVSGPPWMVVEVERPVGRTNVTYAYEGKLALWDLVGDTPETSIGHVNLAGQTIGLSFQWNDADAVPDLREHRLGTSGPEGRDESWNSSVFSDFMFVSGYHDCFDDPAIVGVTSWGAIKASFQR